MKKFILLFSLMVPTSFIFSSSTTTTLADTYGMVTAHRGFSSAAPENTLISIQKAIEIGTDYAEIDVQETSDGVLVLMHDVNALRTTGINKPLWEVSFEELRGASAGAWFHQKYANEKVPTLDEVIAAAKGKIKLNIELKNNGHAQKLAEETVALIEKHHFEKDCTVTSFDENLLQKVKEKNKAIKTGLIIGKLPADHVENIFNNHNYEVLSTAGPIVDVEFMRMAALHNKEVYVWTVNSPSKMTQMLHLGVHNIITDYPDRLIEVLNKQR